MSDTKPTNPKDIIGSSKLPLELVPDVIRAYASLSFLEGAVKYGRFNWRIAGVRASIYKAAIERHLAKWWNGEDCDLETKVPHLASVLACVGIILDAQAAKKLTDDRPPYVDMGAVIADLEARVAHLKALHADKNPKQYTRVDGIIPGTPAGAPPPPPAVPFNDRKTVHIPGCVWEPSHSGSCFANPVEGPVDHSVADYQTARAGGGILPPTVAPAKCYYCGATERAMHALGCPGTEP